VQANYKEAQLRHIRAGDPAEIRVVATKIVQRLRLKIVLYGGQAMVTRLRPGLSVIANVRTKDAGQ
jgi:multidrug resistance efflux pump